jgi:sulfonate transport system permease protein
MNLRRHAVQTLGPYRGNMSDELSSKGFIQSVRLRAILLKATGLVLPALLLTLWFVTSAKGWLPQQILPDPELIYQDFRIMIANGDLLYHTQTSLMRVLQGFAVGGTLGLVLGMGMGLSPRINALFEPIFTVFAQIPSIGLIPFFIMLVGIDESLKILVIAKAAMIPVVVNTYMGIQNVPRTYREVGNVLTFGVGLTLRKIVLPAAIPSIFTGVRYGLTNAWLALVAVELLVSSEGLGFMMVYGRQLFQLDMVIVAMIVVGIIGFLLDAGLARIETRLQRWKLVQA